MEICEMKTIIRIFFFVGGGGLPSLVILMGLITLLGNDVKKDLFWTVTHPLFLGVVALSDALN